jgi:hypothetical protein
MCRSHVEPGEETIDHVRLVSERVTDAEADEQLTVGLPDQGILAAQDVVYIHVHDFLAEQRLDRWQDAISGLEATPYQTILAGHGQPSDRHLYGVARAYLAAAREVLSAATGPDDLTERLRPAYPDYGGTAIHGLQNYFLYPSDG